MDTACFKFHLCFCRMKKTSLLSSWMESSSPSLVHFLTASLSFFLTFILIHSINYCSTVRSKCLLSHMFLLSQQSLKSLGNLQYLSQRHLNLLWSLTFLMNNLEYHSFTLTNTLIPLIMAQIPSIRYPVFISIRNHLLTFIPCIPFIIWHFLLILLNLLFNNICLYL